MNSFLPTMAQVIEAVSAIIVTLSQVVRHCDDIGMMALDRPTAVCRWATAFCRQFCFNKKLYRIYKDMSKKDIRNEAAWQAMTQDDAEKLAVKVKRNKKSATDRFRLMTRGEALSTDADFDRVSMLCSAMSPALVWLPTRAWRNEAFEGKIEELRTKHSNIRLMLSIDPSNAGNKRDEALLERYIAKGFGTMFFGDNTAKENGLNIAGYKLEFKACPKTWNHANGACRTCRGGCFSPAQVHVHLKQH